MNFFSVNFSLNFQSLAAIAISVASYRVGPSPIGISKFKKTQFAKYYAQVKPAVTTLPPVSTGGTGPPIVVIGATKYYIFRSTNENGPYIPVNLIPVTPLDPGPGLITPTSATYMYSDQSLGTGASYYYYVIPVTSGVEGDYSETASDVPFGGEIPWDTEDAGKVMLQAKSNAQNDAGYSPSNLFIIIGPDGLCYQNDQTTGTPSVFSPSVTNNGSSTGLTTADGENYALPGEVADSSSTGSNDIPYTNVNFTGIYRRVTANPSGLPNSYAAIVLPADTDCQHFSYDANTLYDGYNFGDTGCIYMGLDSTGFSKRKNSSSRYAEEIGVLKSNLSKNTDGTSKFPGWRIQGFSHKLSGTSTVPTDGLDWVGEGRGTKGLPPVRYALNGTIKIYFSADQGPGWGTVKLKNNGGTSTTYVPVLNADIPGAWVSGFDPSATGYNPGIALTVITAVGGLSSFNQSSQTMKRVNTIAQEGDHLPTGKNNGMGPVHQWDLSHQGIFGYAADGALVNNIAWLDFQVSGVQVTQSNSSSAGYFPFNRSLRSC